MIKGYAHSRPAKNWWRQQKKLRNTFHIRRLSEGYVLEEVETLKGKWVNPLQKSVPKKTIRSFASTLIAIGCTILNHAQNQASRLRRNHWKAHLESSAVYSLAWNEPNHSFEERQSRTDSTLPWVVVDFENFVVRCSLRLDLE
jgi:hypothetical protein